MRRREFIALAAIWPLAARSLEHVRRIGVLLGASESDPADQSWIGAFQRQLDQSGWNDESKLQIVFRFTGDAGDRVHTFADDLVHLAPDAVVVGGQLALDAMRQATGTIPLVFVQVSEGAASPRSRTTRPAHGAGRYSIGRARPRPLAGSHVGQGIVASMARPGGTITGFTSLEFSTGGKILELLKEIAPIVDKIVVLVEPKNASNAGHFRTMQSVAS